jgi:hypothetical protein
MFNLILVLISIPFLLLGAHGLYSYFHPIETIFSAGSESTNKLFFAFSVPEVFSNLVDWMSWKGFQSFFVPIIFFACGIGLIWFAYNRGLNFSLPRFRLFHSSKSNNRYNSRNVNYKTGFRPILIKILLSLCIIVGIIIMVWFGYRVFTHEISPLVGSITFLIGIAFLIFLIWFLRRKYIWFKPSFKVVTLSVIVIIFVFAFAGVEPFQAFKNNVVDVFSGKANNSGVVNSTQQKCTFRTGSITWEVVLKSAKWNGNKINTELVATNKGNTPADFPYENVSELGVVVDFGLSDSYGMWYSTDKSQNYDVYKVYPGESRVFKPSFTINSRSGDVTLYVTRFTGTSKFSLFKLKSPN